MPRIHPYAPVVAFDIDGTTGQYHGHFINFAREWLGESVVANWRRTNTGEFSEALGLEKHIYRHIKLAYRQGGKKRSMPVVDGVSDCLPYIQSQGIQVWFCTTRPWERLDNIDPDTREWLRRAGVTPYGLIYGEDKYQQLVDIVGEDRVLVVVDDLPEQIEAANALGLKTIMMVGAHNQWWRNDHPEQHIAHSIKQATGDIDAIIADWQEKNG